MIYPNYTAPRHIRVYRDFCWYARYIFNHTSDVLAGLAIVTLIILLPIMAAFVV